MRLERGGTPLLLWWGAEVPRGVNWRGDCVRKLPVCGWIRYTVDSTTNQVNWFSEFELSRLDARRHGA